MLTRNGKNYDRFNWIEDRLAQGGFLDVSDEQQLQREIYSASKEFDVMLFCVKDIFPSSELKKELEEQGKIIIHFPFIDEQSEPNLGKVRQLQVFLCEQLEKGKKVLITCHGGYNRSGLFTASCLMGYYLYQPEEAIKRVQTKRDGALFNKTFIEMLKKYDWYIPGKGLFKRD